MNYIIEAYPLGKIDILVELLVLYLHLAENVAGLVRDYLWTDVVRNAGVMRREMVEIMISKS